jgi:hypothetical protein
VSRIKEEFPDCRFILLTTTIPNFHIDDIEEKYKWYTDGLGRFRKTKLFKDVLGWHRSEEITTGTEKDSKGKPLKNRIHLHSHWFICVKESYFSKGYITQKEWLKGIVRSLRDENIKVLDIRVIGGSEKDIREVCKYIIKPTDFLDNLLYFEKLADALKGKRLSAKGGAIKRISVAIKKEHKELRKSGGTLLAKAEVYLWDIEKQIYEHAEDRYKFVHFADFFDPREYRLLTPSELKGFLPPNEYEEYIKHLEGNKDGRVRENKEGKRVYTGSSG